MSNRLNRKPEPQSAAVNRAVGKLIRGPSLGDWLKWEGKLTDEHYAAGVKHIWLFGHPEHAFASVCEYKHGRFRYRVEDGVMSEQFPTLEQAKHNAVKAVKHMLSVGAAGIAKMKEGQMDAIPKLAPGQRLIPVTVTPDGEVIKDAPGTAEEFADDLPPGAVALAAD